MKEITTSCCGGLHSRGVELDEGWNRWGYYQAQLIIEPPGDDPLKIHLTHAAAEKLHRLLDRFLAAAEEDDQDAA